MNDLQTLLEKAELLAKEKTDGHLSILKFTTGYKVFLGTPNLDIGEEREKVNKMQSFIYLNEALDNVLKTNISIWDI
ncbi:MAG: hypothetical protein ISR68_00440 [Campylobacterales bacterium]|nr:hypothetical protein [Campylobacterales bacterium]